MKDTQADEQLCLESQMLPESCHNSVYQADNTGQTEHMNDKIQVLD